MSLTKQQIEQRDKVRAWGVNLLPKILSDSIESYISVGICEVGTVQTIRTDGVPKKLLGNIDVILYDASYMNILNQPIKFQPSMETFVDNMELFFNRNDFFFIETNVPEPGKWPEDYIELDHEPTDKLQFLLLPNEIKIHALRDKNEALQLRLNHSLYLKQFDPSQMTF